jgi:hypothetical protein
MTEDGFRPAELEGEGGNIQYPMLNFQFSITINLTAGSGFIAAIESSR